VWWVVSIFHIGENCGTISLRRRFEKDLRAMDKRQLELIKMFLLLQRERGRRKEILGGT
jgi:hypothetical protein